MRLVGSHLPGDGIFLSSMLSHEAPHNPPCSCSHSPEDWGWWGCGCSFPSHQRVSQPPQCQRHVWAGRPSGEVHRWRGFWDGEREPGAPTHLTFVPSLIRLSSRAGGNRLEPAMESGDCKPTADGRCCLGLDRLYSLRCESFVFSTIIHFDL